jgi:hypothetical protein
MSASDGLDAGWFAAHGERDGCGATNCAIRSVALSSVRGTNLAR